uniref:G domain-containing protein n=1 Tax=Eutreptiella gymnastica TaxID=73025 RepID=A0A7S1N4K5_9EUGL|mmetsp:Transcript_119257/g.207571  ORF Transcript_119257/g.207571 Transcript_119257/m.207571 type:complete len:439 (+) Transcript_119257:70-1386(+)
MSAGVPVYRSTAYEDYQEAAYSDIGSGVAMNGTQPWNPTPAAPDPDPGLPAADPLPDPMPGLACAEAQASDSFSGPVVYSANLHVDTEPLAPASAPEPMEPPAPAPTAATIPTIAPIDPDRDEDRSLTETDTSMQQRSSHITLPPRTVSQPTVHTAFNKANSPASTNLRASTLNESAAAAVRLKAQQLSQKYPVGSTRQVNCLLIGRVGNGKSSLINSLYQTLTGGLDTLCREGSGDSSCTLKYACTASLWEKQALPLLLFDTKGLPDANDKVTRSMLRNILKGKFRTNHSMNNPKFRDCSLLPDKNIRIDVVIFVYAYGSVFPHRLADAIRDEAAQRQVSVVPVITFYDLVEHDEQLNVHLDCCKRTFNTHPLHLTNLTAIKRLPRESQSSALTFSQQQLLDVASQSMVYGQQHQRYRRLDINRPIPANAHKDCTLM